MDNGKLDSIRSSDRASRTRPRPPSRRKTEAEFLADQTNDAKRAMKQTARDMAATLTLAAKQHPWAMTAAAAAAGVLIGATVLGPRRPDAAHSDADRTSRRKPRISFLAAALGRALSGALTTAIGSLVTAAVVARPEPADELDSEPVQRLDMECDDVE